MKTKLFDSVMGALELGNEIVLKFLIKQLWQQGASEFKRTITAVYKAKQQPKEYSAYEKVYGLTDIPTVNEELNKTLESLQLFEGKESLSVEEQKQKAFYEQVKQRAESKLKRLNHTNEATFLFYAAYLIAEKNLALEEKTYAQLEQEVSELNIPLTANKLPQLLIVYNSLREILSPTEEERALYNFFIRAYTESEKCAAIAQELWPKININLSSNDLPLINYLCLEYNDTKHDLLFEFLQDERLEKDQKNSKGQTILHQLCQVVVLTNIDTQFTLIQDLIRLKIANINTPDNNGDTPLHHLLSADFDKEKKIGLLKELLKLPEIMLNHVNNSGETPLYLAWGQGQECMQELLTVLETKGNPLWHDALNTFCEKMISMFENKIQYAATMVPIFAHLQRAKAALANQQQNLQANAPDVGPPNFVLTAGTPQQGTPQNAAQPLPKFDFSS